jgi:hypothetical protein
VASGAFVFSWSQNAGSVGGFVTWTHPVTGANTTVAARATPVTKEHVCAKSPASTVGWRDWGTVWQATVPLGAAAGAAVTYTVGDTAFTSAPLAFNVPAAPGAATGEQHFLIYADQGLGFDDESYEGRNYNTGLGAYNTFLKSNAVLAGKSGVQGLVVSGDVTYADGYMAQWQEWFDMMQPTTTQTPLLISSGNHVRQLAAPFALAFARMRAF